MSAGQFAVKDLAAALQRLSDLVYAPLAKHLTNVSHLILCPDGQLSRLPFEMLPVGNKFLVEEKTISYVTSGREVVRLAGGQATSRLKTKNAKSLVMGNPDFDFNLGSTRASRVVADAASATSTISPGKARRRRWPTRFSSPARARCGRCSVWAAIQWSPGRIS